MYCPICNSRSLRISHGPNTSARNIAVKLAYTVRTVM
jgi:Zn finger protein HypA/HybF involved in hydrogenase expression